MGPGWRKRAQRDRVEAAPIPTANAAKPLDAATATRPTARAASPWRNEPVRRSARRGPVHVFYSLWIGSHFIAADHAPRSRADVLKLALSRLEA